MRSLRLLALVLGAGHAAAGQVTLSATQDNTIYSENTTFSNGAGNGIFVGRTGFGGIRRALIAFDIAGNVPSGSTILSADLVLEMTMTIAGNTDVSVHRVLATWGEGTSMGANGEGLGAPATQGDATWTHRFFNTQTWTGLGGDFVPASSALTGVLGNGPYAWAGPGMVADVQLWLDSPAQNAGWLLLGDESTFPTAKRFDSRTSAGVGGVPPTLILTYSGPPVGNSFCTPGQAGVIGCPCANPPAGVDRGCDNSAGTGGATLVANGVASLTVDSVQFTTSNELPTALSAVFQGDAEIAGGVVFGEGVRCTAGHLRRLHFENAVGGSIVYPDGGEPLISVQSAALGDPIGPASTRLYQVHYRDPLLTCTGEPDFNATQSIAVTWHP